MHPALRIVDAMGQRRCATRRALKRIGGSSEKPSFGTGWIWELPELAS